MPVTGRYLTLDAMRGVAALLVAVYHFQKMAPTGDMTLSPSYLAVDFFLMLSGFVIAKAYESRLKSGLPLLDFLRLRFVRLYPLFIASIILGVALPAAKILAHHGTSWGTEQFLVWLGENSLGLPALNYNPQLLFPLNPPAWSLFFEVIINLIFAVALIWMPRAMLAVVAVVAATVTTFGAYTYGTWNLGWGWEHAGYGFARTIFGFSAGMMAFRFGVGVKRRVTSLSLAPIIVLAVAIVAPLSEAISLPFSLAIAMIGFPLLLWIAAGIEPPSSMRASASLAGDISYPIYILHYPILQMTVAALGFSLLSVTAFIVATVIASYIALKFYDEPVRRFLSSRSRGRLDASRL